MPMTTSRRLGVLACALAITLAAAGSAVAASPPEVPFSATSPFNLMVPPDAPVASNGESLAGRSLSAAYAEYTPAVYTSSESDPEFTIRLKNNWGRNALNGRTVRLSPDARRAEDLDGHLTIVVPYEDVVISLYQAEQGPRADGTWWASWGGMAPLSGSGGNRTDSRGGRESGISQLAGLITPDDVRRGIAAGEDGDLGHALALLHNQVSNSVFVHPAIQAGGNSATGLYMGQRVFLDPTLDVGSLSFEGGPKEQRFGRLVARTLQRYGAIVVTNSSATGFQLVNPASWTSIGAPNPWPDLIGPDRGGYYGFAVRAIPSSRLRAMDPSGGDGVPPSSVAAASGRARLGFRGWAGVVRRLVARSRSQVTLVLRVRSRRTAVVRLGASLRPLGSERARVRVRRASAQLAAGGTATLVVRMPLAAGTRARLTLIATARDRSGLLRVLRRERVAIVGAPGGR